MNILGHGLDVVDVSRIATLLAKDEDFILGWFTLGNWGSSENVGPRLTWSPGA